MNPLARIQDSRRLSDPIKVTLLLLVSLGLAAVLALTIALTITGAFTPALGASVAIGLVGFVPLTY